MMYIYFNFIYINIITENIYFKYKRLIELQYSTYFKFKI